jgi:NodT family efflux transporter outer membrane factor (OMF) lipoprotein
MFRNFIHRAAGVLPGLALAGCVATGNIQPANTAINANELATEKTFASAQIEKDQWPTDNWWLTFNDPQLNKLVERALAGSPSLQIARARIEQARGYAMQIGSQRQIQAALNFEATGQHFSENYLYPPPIGGSNGSDGRLALDFSYELDFWGRQANATQAADLRVDEARTRLTAARLMLAVSVVRTYFDLASQYDLIDVAQENLNQKNEILTLTQSRYRSGIDSSVQLKQAESQVATAKFGVEYTDASAENLRQELAALVGAGPDEGLELQIPHPKLIAPPPLPSTLPLDLVSRRPDILALRQEIDATSKDLGAARAEAYPNVNLAAFVGLQSFGIDKLMKSGSQMYGVGPAIHLPIFDGNRVRGGVTGASGAVDEAIAHYNEAILTAMRDVAQQLSGIRYLAREREQQRIAQAAAEEAYRLAELRYKEGIDNYLTLLSAQSSLLTQHFLAAQLDSEQRTLVVELIRALGGGYDPAHPTS